MRCCLTRNGRFGAVEVLADTSDDAAIRQAAAFFETRKDAFMGFEVWDRTRLVHRHPPAAPKYG